MTVKPLTEADLPALARASGLDGNPERLAALAATLPIVNEIRAALWARPRRPESEPSHIFVPEEDS
ncbi:MAG: hypothetical protein QM636_15845 [Rhizobium sp.]